MPAAVAPGALDDVHICRRHRFEVVMELEHGILDAGRRTGMTKSSPWCCTSMPCPAVMSTSPGAIRNRNLAAAYRENHDDGHQEHELV